MLDVEDKTSRRMARVKQRDTIPELDVRKVVHSLGFRYRINNRDLPGSPDLVNRSRGWAIFVHGCFWHSHEGCSKATVPKRNRYWWLAKLHQNVERDERVIESLTAMGYRVLVIWECDTKENQRLVKLVERFFA